MKALEGADMLKNKRGSCIRDPWLRCLNSSELSIADRPAMKPYWLKCGRKCSRTDFVKTGVLLISCCS
jgi:hypothetical protein